MAKKGPSSSGSQDTSGTSSGTSSTQLPDWLTSAAQQAVGTATTLSQDPNTFTPYGGQQVADISPATQQAWNSVTGGSPTQTAQQVGDAANTIYGSIAGTAQPQQQQYIQQGLQNAQGLLGGWAGQGPASAQQVAQDAQSMMSPYSSAVLNPMMQLGQQALSQNLQTIGAGANQAGAFGGSRQGVQEGVAQSQEAMQMANLYGNMLNTGYNTALGQAGTLANTRQQLGENAASTLAAQQATAGGQMAGYAQNDVTNALQAGQGIPQQFLNNLLGVGTGQQEQAQAGINANMGNYYATQQQPIQNLDVLLSTLGGVPYGTSTSQNATTSSTGNNQVNNQTNPLSGALGGAASGASIGAAFGPIGAGIGGVAGGLLGAFQ